MLFVVVRERSERKSKLFLKKQKTFCQKCSMIVKEGTHINRHPLFLPYSPLPIFTIVNCLYLLIKLFIQEMKTSKEKI